MTSSTTREGPRGLQVAGAQAAGAGSPDTHPFPHFTAGVYLWEMHLIQP